VLDELSRHDVSPASGNKILCSPWLAMADSEHRLPSKGDVLKVSHLAIKKIE
jgi:hypothetical protein